jgi:hypothetical protein
MNSPFPLVFLKRLAIALAFGTAAISGASAQTFERGVDRPGLDYRSFDLREADPSSCERACVRDGRCVAWTYVAPGIQSSTARCWLKNGIPRGIRSGCCTSGVVRG